MLLLPIGIGYGVLLLVLPIKHSMFQFGGREKDTSYSYHIWREASCCLKIHHIHGHK